MINANILFDKNGVALTPDRVISRIKGFGDSYLNATKDIIRDSQVLDKEGTVFIKCASRILSNFGMTRRGIFHDRLMETLINCWQTIGPNLLDINSSILNRGVSRGRFLLEINEDEREVLISEIWSMTKALLPFTMSKSSYGLVGASKILFSVLPEIVLPTDNNQWMRLFKTVDLGDIIRFMVKDIQKWEASTNKQLNDLDPSRRLSTLPSVYNVIAMAARPLG